MSYEQACHTPRLRRSKTDQTGQARTIGVVYGNHELTCPVLAYRAWRELVATQHGIDDDAPVWRRIYPNGRIGTDPLTADTIGRIVQRRLAGTGINPAEWGGHSLRRGHATEAARNGASDRSIMRTGNWTSQQTLNRYIDDATLFHNPSSSKLDL